jgi:hypothetical protein
MACQHMKQMAIAMQGKKKVVHERLSSLRQQIYLRDGRQHRRTMLVHCPADDRLE